MRGGSFRMGGAVFHFSQKIGLKSTKNMRFCILHKPMGGARAPPRPPPGYATGYLRYIGLHDESLDCFNQLLDIYEKSSTIKTLNHEIAQINHSIGSCLLSLHKFDDALKFLYQALEIKKNDNSRL